MPDATINGYKHHWQEMGSGDAFVLFHGAAGSGRSLTDVGQELSKDFRVIIPDMRGMGDSERVTSIAPDAWVEDLCGLLNHLNIDKAHVYGTSLGARVALKFVITYPERSRSLILEGAVIAFETEGSNVMNSRLSNVDDMPPEAVARYERLHGADWKDAVKIYYAWRNDPATHAYYDLHESSKTVTVPTFLTRGDAREPVHPMPHTFELFDNIKGSRLWIKRDGGLFATSEGFEKVREFIRDPEGRPPAVIR